MNAGAICMRLCIFIHTYARPIDSLLHGEETHMLDAPDAEEEKLLPESRRYERRWTRDRNGEMVGIGGMGGKGEWEAVCVSPREAREEGKGEEDARATKRTGVGCAHEGRLKGEKEEDGIKRGKKGGGREEKGPSAGKG